MSKPHTRCYDMECDECPENDTCPSADEADPGMDVVAVDLAALVAQVKSLSAQYNELSEQHVVLAGIIHQTREQLGRFIAAIVRVANEEE